MVREEFIGILQKTLAASMGSSQVEENISYYQDYIDVQVRSGFREEDVIEQLGDPRLLAKSIIEAGRHAGNQEEVYEEIYDENDPYREERTGPRVYRMPGWLIFGIILLVIITVIGIAASIIWSLIPFLIPFACVLFLFRLFGRRR